jgi:hypothetical protein
MVTFGRPSPLRLLVSLFISTCEISVIMVG